MDQLFESGLRHILIPTNFSETARAALEYGYQLSRAFGARLTLLHVTEVTRMSRDAVGMDAIDHLYDVLKLPADEGRVIPSHHSLDQLVTQAGRLMERALPAEWREHVEVDLVAVAGRPAPEIVKFARAHEADLVIMGTHRQWSLSRWLQGSLADSIVRQLDCPVLVVQPETKRRPVPAFTPQPIPQTSMSSYSA